MYWMLFCWCIIEGIWLRGKKTKMNQSKEQRGYDMPTSKKQLVKLNQAKKVKAEELSKQAAAGSKEAQKKLKKLEKKLK